MDKEQALMHVFFLLNDIEELGLDRGATLRFATNIEEYELPYYLSMESIAELVRKLDYIIQFTTFLKRDDKVLTNQFKRDILGL